MFGFLIIGMLGLLMTLLLLPLLLLLLLCVVERREDQRLRVQLVEFFDSKHLAHITQDRCPDVLEASMSLYHATF